MKSLLYTLLIAFIVGAFACGDKDEPGNNPPKKTFDRNAMVRIRAQESSSKKTLATGEMSYEDSVKFIVRWASSWRFKSEVGGERWFGKYGRDTVSHKLLWWGDDVIQISSIDPVTADTVFYLGRFVTERTNFVVTMGIHDDGTPYQWDSDLPDFEIIPSKDLDTVAYIPNKIVLAARERIIEAFNEGDFKRVYELFDSAYVFIPTTGEKYRTLMDKGEN